MAIAIQTIRFEFNRVGNERYAFILNNATSNACESSCAAIAACCVVLHWFIAARVTLPVLPVVETQVRN